MSKKLPVMSRLGVVFLTWRRHLEKTTKSHSLTLNQYYILRQLKQKEYLNPSEIAEMLFADRPTATVVIDNLKKYGYVRKERDAEDGKRIRVSITEAGVRQVDKAEKDMEEMTTFDPLACLSEEEKQTLEALLVKMQNHMKNLNR
jgi:DNA-binding MarR family transcriptional regulator